MTLTDTPTPAPAPVPARSRGRGLIIGASVALLLATAGVVTATSYFDSVPLVETNSANPIVPYDALPKPVGEAFVAAVDPDFYDDDGALLNRRYAVLAAGAESETGIRTWVIARKLDSEFTKTEILERYLARADFGPAASGLNAAAQTYFQKPATELTVAEAAALAVRLGPADSDPTTAWNKILDTMVERGWLTSADRGALTYPS